MTEAAIIGVGMTPFGKYPQRTLKSLGSEAIEKALHDAGLETSEIDMAFVSNSMSATITGQTAVIGQTILRACGFSGIPVFNVDNACAGSSSALNLAVQAVRAGTASTVLVVGVEKLTGEDRTRAYLALNGAADPDVVARSGIDPAHESVFVTSIYPARINEYSARYRLRAETLAEIAVKNRCHAAKNPLAQYRDPLTVAAVLDSRRVVGPVTALMCAPIGDGASAVIVTSAARISRGHRPVFILASVIGMGAPPGKDRSVATVAKRAYSDAGLSPTDISVAEVHDSVSFNELLAYEELGFATPGAGARLVAEGATSIGGSIPVNPSGGLESRGHPVAATGLAQIVELATQLRGEGGERQVSGVRYAIAENAGGFARDDTAAIAVTILGAQFK